MRPGPQITESIKSTYLLYKETRRMYRNYQDLLEVKKKTCVDTSHLKEPQNLPRRYKHFSKNKKKKISNLRLTARRKLIQANRHPLYLAKRQAFFMSFRFFKFLNRYNSHHRLRGYSDFIKAVPTIRKISDARSVQQKSDYILYKKNFNCINKVNLFLN